MAGGSDGVRLGAVVDRDLVAERIAARTAPLPALAPAAPVDRPRPPQPTVAGGAAGVLVDEIDYGRVEAVRTPTGIALAAFVARAVVDGARRHPAVNGGVRPVHLAIGGRVVRDAGALRLRTLAAAIDGDGDGESDGESDGATFAIVDGSGGGARTTIVPPAPGIPCLAIGRVTTRPVARPGPDAGWALVMRPVGDLSLAFDHRAIDTGDAAAFLADVRRSLEDRPWDVEL